MINMRKNLLLCSVILNIVFVVLFVFIIVPYVKTDNTLNKAIISRFNSESTYYSDGFLVDIDGKYFLNKETVNKDTSVLESHFGFQKPGNDAAQRRLIENELNQMLIVLQAIDDQVVNSKDFDNYIWVHIKSAIYTYYINETLKKAKISKEEFKPEEVAKMKKTLEEFYVSIGVDKKMIPQLINKQITDSKNTLMKNVYENDLLNKIKLKRRVEVKY
jgi:hypothetical protein